MKVLTKIEELESVPIGERFLLSRYLLVQLKPNEFKKLMKKIVPPDHDFQYSDSMLRQGIEVLIRPKTAHHITDNQTKGGQR